MEEMRRPLCTLGNSAEPPGSTPRSHREVVLRLVPQPAPGPVPVLKRVPGAIDPFFIGGGQEDLLCGNCDFVLAFHVSREQLPRLVFICPQCGYFSDTD